MRAICLLLLCAAAVAAFSQERIVRLNGYDGSFYYWSEGMYARAAKAENQWLQPVLSSEASRRWRDVLTAEGYDGKWENLIGATKELPIGKGDVPVKAHLLFKAVPQGARFVVVVPEVAVAAGTVSSNGSQGLSAATEALGGNSALQALKRELDLAGHSGESLWQAASQAVSAEPHPVFLPSKQILWVQSLPPRRVRIGHLSEGGRLQAASS